MYKCDKCENVTPAVVELKGVRHCIACCNNESSNALKPCWLGPHHEFQVMEVYGRMGTRLFKGKEN